VVKAGAAILADSRVENLKKLRNFNLPKMLLRIPMLSQIDEVLEYADISLNSEYKVIEALSNAAVKKGKIHDIILMVDLGDLREGVWADDAVEYAGKILQLKGVNLKGIGTNLTCYGAIIPQEDNLSKLEEIANMITQKYGIKLSIISGGNSSSLYMVEEGRIPKAINNLRLGESIVLGNETAYGKRIEGTYNDCFTLCAEIIELKEKPSVPIGEIGVDAFGNRPTFVDRGIRKRGILAVGKQDVRIDGLTPIDSDIIILGASSDHMIIDITDSTKEYTIGDIIEFTLDYGALLSTSTSNYVKKVIE
ncbi:MAG: ornithine racemase Orr, partial [Lutispora sp.]|nr:ornithine racemase Orr [Lutispora sp.]